MNQIIIALNSGTVACRPDSPVVRVWLVKLVPQVCLLTEMVVWRVKAGRC